MTLRLQVYEFLALPAHFWLCMCAWMCGYTFTYGPCDDDEADDLLEKITREEDG